MGNVLGGCLGFDLDGALWVNTICDRDRWSMGCCAAVEAELEVSNGVYLAIERRKSLFTRFTIRRSDSTGSLFIPQGVLQSFNTPSH